MPVARCLSWQIVVCIALSVGLHGLLLVWMTSGVDETPSLSHESQSVEIMFMVDLSPQTERESPIAETTIPSSANVLRIPEKRIEAIAEPDREKVMRVEREAEKELEQTHTHDTAVAEPVAPSNLLMADAVLSPPLPPLAAISTSSPEMEVSKQAKESYLSSLRAAINHLKYYPTRAWRMGKQGQAWVAFVIYRDGRIDQVTIRESSGEPMLDRAARESVLKLGRYQPFPEHIDSPFLSVTVPMNYSTH